MRNDRQNWNPEEGKPHQEQCRKLKQGNEAVSQLLTAWLDYCCKERSLSTSFRTKIRFCFRQRNRISETKKNLWNPLSSIHPPKKTGSLIKTQWPNATVSYQTKWKSCGQKKGSKKGTALKQLVRKYIWTHYPFPSGNKQTKTKKKQKTKSETDKSFNLLAQVK